MLAHRLPSAKCQALNFTWAIRLWNAASRCSAPDSRASADSCSTRRSSRCMKNVLPEPQSPNRPIESGGSTSVEAISEANAVTSSSMSSGCSKSSAASTPSAL